MRLHPGVAGGTARPLFVVRDDQGLARLCHVTHGAFADGQPCTDRYLSGVVVGDDLELVRRFVVDRELPAAHPQQADRTAQHRLEQLGQLELRGKVGHRLEQRFLLVGAPALGRQQLPLALHEAGTRDGDARLRGGRREDVEVLLGERLGLLALHDEDARRLTLDDERDVHLGAR